MIQTYAGTALSVQAQNIEDPAQKKALYEEAIKYYDKAKELDPDRLQSNWGYNRYNAYYNLYGADDPKTKQAEADSILLRRRPHRKVQPADVPMLLQQELVKLFSCAVSDVE